MATAAFEFEVKGLEDVLARVRALGEAGQQALGYAIQKEAQEILRASQEVVPWSPGGGGGNLARSGKVLPVAGALQEGQTYSVVIGYGSGESQPYALAVHEHLSEHSPRSWKIAESGASVRAREGLVFQASGGGVHWTKPGTGPKYLERPFLEATKGMADRIARIFGERLASKATSGAVATGTGGGTRGGGLG